MKFVMCSCQNKVSRIHEIIFYLRLKRLDVSHNGISNIGESAFKGVGQLDYLNISFNSLREFKSNTFKGLTRLFELDASHNELVIIDLCIRWIN